MSTSCTPTACTAPGAPDGSRTWASPTNTSDYDPGELLAAIERIVARHSAEAWDEGRNATWTHIGLRRGLAPDNPYARD